jgi:hypothetical protein
MTFPTIPSDTPSSYVNEPAAPTIEAFDGVLVASTAHAVTFVSPHVGVRIENVSGSSPIFYTLDGSTPAVGTSPEIAAVAGAAEVVALDNDILVVVTLISAGTPTYSVVGLDEEELHEDEITDDHSA